jgi:hypothetical protein
MQMDRDTDANWSEVPVEGKTTPKRVRHRENGQLPHMEGRALNELLSSLGFRRGGLPSDNRRFESRPYLEVSLSQDTLLRF